MMRSDLRAWLRDESGATAIEYGLIASLVTLALILGLTTFRGSMTDMYTYISSTLSGAIGS